MAKLMKQRQQHQQSSLPTVLELGCGCAIPGLLCAKMKCSVILTDYPVPDEAAWKCTMLEQTVLNHVNDNCRIIPLIWSQFNSNLLEIAYDEQLDYIIAADCFYDKNLFESLIVTVAFLLENQSSNCTFITTYHERVESYNITALLSKWNLVAKEILLDDMSDEIISNEIYKSIYSLQPDVNSSEKYTEAITRIHLLEIYKKE
jgi:hypothetical protein